MKQNTTPNREDVDERAPIRGRWTEQSPGPSDEAFAGTMLRSAAAVKPFGAKDLAKVGARLHARERYRPRPLAWQLAFGAIFVCFGGALSAAVSHVWRARHDSAVKDASPAVGLGRNGTKKHIRRAPPAAPSAEAAPSIEEDSPPPATPSSTVLPTPPAAPAPQSSDRTPAPTPPPALPKPSSPSSEYHPVAALPSRRWASREIPAPAPEVPPTQPSSPGLAPAPQPPPGPSALAQESRLLARAIASLRQGNNAEQALALLDQHRAEFGTRSPLAPEAMATRIEALLRLGQHGQALSLLDAQALSATGIEHEMLVARAELRADKNRRTAALRDFDLALAAGVKPDSVSERALYGRAACRGASGDWEGARRDFRTYLATYPTGKFADKARAALEQDIR